MDEWSLDASGLKRYPHFDSWLSAKDAIALATDPHRVVTHPFYPFIKYVQHWNRYADKGKKGKAKDRPIRYASRGDAYIFAYYRDLLSKRYELALTTQQLSNSVLAYRKIPTEEGQGGKCNIHFARDAVSKIQELGNCAVVALDISGFFEHLDHKSLLKLWCKMLGKSRLPDDHHQVFKAITQYSIVNKQELYERLGYFGPKRRTKSGKIIKGYLKPFSSMPIQLCTGKEFRTKIAGGDGKPSAVKKNHKPYGIPQGAPISDLLANLYLLDFDILIAGWVKELGGYYFRYSDDILIVIPGGPAEGLKIMSNVRDAIGKFGSKLLIKEEKSSVFAFKKGLEGQEFELVHGIQGRNGLEYLGFRYNGQHVYIRDSTLSNLYRKITRAARYSANSLARRYPNKDTLQIQSAFDYDRLIERFGRVRDFGELSSEYRTWTFWTYARRSAKIFGPKGTPILNQLKNYRANIRRKADQEIERAVMLRDAPKSA
jgi:hypothetical protein